MSDIDWRAEMVKENLWDYSLKYVPVPPVVQMVLEIEAWRKRFPELMYAGTDRGIADRPTDPAGGNL